MRIILNRKTKQPVGCLKNLMQSIPQNHPPVKWRRGYRLATSPVGGWVLVPDGSQTRSEAEDKYEIPTYLRDCWKLTAEAAQLAGLPGCEDDDWGYEDDDLVNHGDISYLICSSERMDDDYPYRVIERENCSSSVFGGAR
jgi:hypothetical protein